MHSLAQSEDTLLVACRPVLAAQVGRETLSKLAALPRLGNLAAVLCVEGVLKTSSTSNTVPDVVSLPATSLVKDDSQQSSSLSTTTKPSPARAAILVPIPARLIHSKDLLHVQNGIKHTDDPMLRPFHDAVARFNSCAFWVYALLPDGVTVESLLVDSTEGLSSSSFNLLRDSVLCHDLELLQARATAPFPSSQDTNNNNVLTVVPLPTIRDSMSTTKPTSSVKSENKVVSDLSTTIPGNTTHPSKSSTTNKNTKQQQQTTMKNFFKGVSAKVKIDEKALPDNKKEVSSTPVIEATTPIGAGVAKTKLQGTKRQTTTKASNSKITPKSKPDVGENDLKRQRQLAELDSLFDDEDEDEANIGEAEVDEFEGVLPRDDAEPEIVGSSVASDYLHESGDTIGNGKKVEPTAIGMSETMVGDEDNTTQGSSQAVAAKGNSTKKRKVNAHSSINSDNDSGDNDDNEGQKKDSTKRSNNSAISKNVDSSTTKKRGKKLVKKQRVVTVGKRTRTEDYFSEVSCSEDEATQHPPPQKAAKRGRTTYNGISTTAKSITKKAEIESKDSTTELIDKSTDGSTTGVNAQKSKSPKKPTKPQPQPSIKTNKVGKGQTSIMSFFGK